MPTLNFHERKHFEKLLQQEASLKHIFDEFVRKSSVLMTGWKSNTSENVWYRNVRIEKAIEKEVQELHDKITANITNYSSDAWSRSNVKYDELVDSYIKGMPINEIRKRGMYARNEEALDAFLKRKVNDLSLSDRVWKVTGTAKENIEYYLQSGIGTGRSADKISQDVRQILKEPDRRFRRIRNAEGKLVMSQPMKDYHPGTGVYRSSYMNAKRLAVTETNAAYRTADHTRWASLDFVLGVDIKRSNWNKGACPTCDPMVGRYPKDYKFIGWHPFCICMATPVLMDEDDFIDSLVDDGVADVSGITESEGAQFKPAKTMAEVKQRMNDLGIDVFRESGFGLDHANATLEALERVPENARPSVIGNFQQIANITGRKLPSNFYGVHIDADNITLLKSEVTPKMRELYRVFESPHSDKAILYTDFSKKGRSFDIMGVNSRQYKTPDEILKHKVKAQSWYQARNEKYYIDTALKEPSFTHYHELGHSYDSRQRIIGGDKSIDKALERWHKESKIGHLKFNNSEFGTSGYKEAFADAFADYHITGGKNLPEYLLDEMNKLLK